MGCFPEPICHVWRRSAPRHGAGVPDSHGVMLILHLDRLLVHDLQPTEICVCLIRVSISSGLENNDGKGTLGLGATPQRFAAVFVKPRLKAPLEPCEATLEQNPSADPQGRRSLSLAGIHVGV